MFQFQRCRAHEIQNEPMAWECQESGLSLSQVVHRFSRANHASGDSYRCVRESDGEDFCESDARQILATIPAERHATFQKAEWSD